jgi:hypothetical protein
VRQKKDKKKKKEKDKKGKKEKAEKANLNDQCPLVIFLSFRISCPV